MLQQKTFQVWCDSDGYLERVQKPLQNGSFMSFRRSSGRGFSHFRNSCSGLWVIANFLNVFFRFLEDVCFSVCAWSFLIIQRRFDRDSSHVMLVPSEMKSRPWKLYPTPSLKKTHPIKSIQCLTMERSVYIWSVRRKRRKARQHICVLCLIT